MTGNRSVVFCSAKNMQIENLDYPKLKILMAKRLPTVSS